MTCATNDNRCLDSPTIALLSLRGKARFWGEYAVSLTRLPLDVDGCLGEDEEGINAYGAARVAAHYARRVVANEEGHEGRRTTQVTANDERQGRDDD